MPQLSQDMFDLMYADTRRPAGADEMSDYPKLVLWSLASPLTFYTGQRIQVNVLQRQDEPYGSWTFTATAIPSMSAVDLDKIHDGGKTVSNQEAPISTSRLPSFESALEEVSAAIDDLIAAGE